MFPLGSLNLVSCNPIIALLLSVSSPMISLNFCWLLSPLTLREVIGIVLSVSFMGGDDWRIENLLLCGEASIYGKDDVESVVFGKGGVKMLLWAVTKLFLLLFLLFELSYPLGTEVSLILWKCGEGIVSGPGSWSSPVNKSLIIIIGGWGSLYWR